MVANLRSARVERCQAKMDAMSRIETARSLFLCLKLHSKKVKAKKILGSKKYTIVNKEYNRNNVKNDKKQS
ncbi:TPA: hypothetical protein ACSTO7_002209 [Staphylococcus aureus]